jgi:hypothetical protein
MVVGEFRVERISFPEPAAGYAQQRRTDDLIAELGDHYGKYHAFLAALGRDLGPRPDPRDYQHDPDAYFAACALRQELVVAEQLLRRCRAYRRTGQSIGDDAPGEPPLRDARNRLIAVDSGVADQSDPGFDDPPGWRPPRPVLPR